MGWGVLSFTRAAAGRLAAASIIAGLMCVAPATAGVDPPLPNMPGPPSVPPSRLGAKPGVAKPGVTKPGVTKPGATKPTKPVRPPSIMFFLAKGDANACGRGCNEWIAAEGVIDAGADGRLQALLNKIGKRKLPIYFHSPGGAVSAGLGIGRILRKHGMTAGVGRTVPAGCDPKVAREPACDKLKRSGRELVAVLDTASAMCNSACVFSLVGAVVRDVDASARLGIHSISVTFSLRRVDANGHVTRMPTHVAPTVLGHALQKDYDRIAAYMREMGIAPGLLDASRKIPSDHIRFLSRDELIAFGVDRRELIDGLWELIEQPSGAAAVKLVQWREPAAGAFRRIILRVSCATPETVRLQFAREVGAERASLPNRYRVKFGTNNLPLGRALKATPVADWLPLEVRIAYLPISVLREDALVIEAAPSSVKPSSTASSSATPSATSSSETSPAPAATVAAPTATVTAQNIGSGLASLASRCVVPPASSTTAEHI
jgi:hypothetical protein